jgi:Tfp pilus assembly protein PilF
LAARDLAGARAALQRSLALNPGNTSNRLKWAQLQFIAGNLPAARKLLTELRGALLSKEERQTLEQVLDAINMATH